MSDQYMVKHLRASHEKGEFRELRYRIVPLQTWFPTHNGGCGIWWSVKVSKKKQQQQEQQQGLTPSPLSQPLAIPDLHTERHLVGTQLKDGRNAYIEHVGWLQTFCKRPYWRALRQATYLPRPSQPFQFTVPADTHSKLFDGYFDAESESILGVILMQQQQLFQRCEATFHTTPHYLRRWLNSEYNSKVFRYTFR